MRKASPQRHSKNVPPIIAAAIYARVSTQDQNCGLQLTELRGFAERMGWTVVEYVDQGFSGMKKSRPALNKLMADARLRKFDVVLVWKLDRFGRSLRDFAENVQVLDGLQIRFIAPSQSIDTDKKNPMGKLMMHLLAAFAEFERDLIVERVNAGLQEYKREFDAGRVGTVRHSRSGNDLPIGRPRRMFRRDKVAEMRKQGRSWREISKELDVPFSTIRRRMMS